MEISPIPPVGITLLTTFKCTAACKNCCFHCGPAKQKMMTTKEMCHYIDKCLNAFPDIKLIVFSGGECTISWEELKKSIFYAHNKGLRTRIVTNGWWATSYKIAKLKIKELLDVGLDEINFSTGDDHQKWIPFKYVRNASIIANRLGLLAAINVETKDNSKFDIDRILSRDKVFNRMISYQEEIGVSKILIEKGIWAQMDNSTNKITYETYEDKIRFKRCDNLFSIIPIDPYGEVMACCGITCKSNPYLTLGNINDEDINDIYQRAFNDILKLWLFIEGPEKIEKFIQEQEGLMQPKLSVGHSCVLCKDIFCNKKKIDILKKHKDKYFSSIMLKYFLFKQKL